MKKYICFPLLALVGGGAAFILRLLQRRTGFEADTGLPIPGNPYALLLVGLRGRGIDRGVADVQQLALPAYRQLRGVFPDQTPGWAARLRESNPEGNYVRSSADQWFSASCPAPS